VVSFTLQPLYPRERAPGTHWIGAWVGPRAVLDAGVNYSKRNNVKDGMLLPDCKAFTNYRKCCQIFTLLLLLLLLLLVVVVVVVVVVLLSRGSF
jgi:hypothetical protein